MKTILVVIFLVANVIVGGNAAQQVIGQILTTDATLALTNVQQRFRFGQVVTADYTYTGTAATTIVNGINIQDNRPPRKTPAVAITGGALGTNTVTIRLTSQRGLGINCQITVYGTP